MQSFTVYDLNECERNPTNSFKFKNCLFGATNIIKVSDLEKFSYSVYGITFDSGGSWNFNKDFHGALVKTMLKML